jgi:hypothetical protein
MLGLLELLKRKKRSAEGAAYLFFISSLVTMLTACGLATPAAAPTAMGITGVVPVTTVEVTRLTKPNSSQVPIATQLPAPTATSIPALPSGLSASELKYRILEQYPNFFFCDPDVYPVAHGDETGLAKGRFPEIQADAELFRAILAHNKLNGITSFSDDQILAIYRDYKKLNAVIFQKMGDVYQFNIQIGTEGRGFTILGTIDGAGTISEQQRKAAFITCPVCLAKGTLIDTPGGQIAVEAMRAGMPVWTATPNGERVKGVVLRVARVAVPVGHRMVQLKLEDGRELSASPGHPTTDGRRLSDLLTGDFLDGSWIIQLAQTSYGEADTYDILPSGTTGFYWANGILIRSTLAPK